MTAIINIDATNYKINLLAPLDLSIPLNSDPKSNVNAWYIDAPNFSPVELGDWIGSTARGGDVNFNTITFNPHSHCTHTETVGHIRTGDYSVNKSLTTYFFLTELISISPEQVGDDFIITKSLLKSKITNRKIKSLVIRTLPNTVSKLYKQYSNSNPPYLEKEAAIYLKELGIEHLLIDLPSVDKERDGGELLSHNAFWNTDGEIRTWATITEFIFVDDKVMDGLYILNLQIAPINNDATPSKPLIFKIEEQWSD